LRRAASSVLRQKCRIANEAFTIKFNVRFLTGFFGFADCARRIRSIQLRDASANAGAAIEAGRA
jgi:hypothetical protein